jgi:MFS family permease
LVDKSYLKQKHNMLFFSMDYIFFAMSLGFMNLNTVLPAFVARLGAPPTLVGAIVTILMLAWNLPQLVAGNLVIRHRRKKPALIRAALIGRPLILAFAAFVALTGANPAWLTLLILVLAVTSFFGSDSFAAVAWFDILGRAFPPDKRGGYISLWQVGKGIGMLGVAALVRYILGQSGPAFPYNYALLFGAGGICLMFSAIACTQMYEPPVREEDPAVTPIAWRDFGEHLIRILREDHRLGRIMLARTLVLLSMMAYPFYVLYATEELHFPEQTIAIFILAQTVGTLLASFILGRVADRFGTQRVVQIGAAVLLTAPLLALVLVLTPQGTADLLHSVYIWIYVCVGLMDNLMLLGYLSYVLDIAPESQRTIYMGINNAIGGLGVLGSTFGGWLLGKTSYGVLFAVSMLLGIGSLAMAFLLPDARPESVTGRIKDPQSLSPRLLE